MGVDEGVDDVLVAVDGSQVEGGVSLRTNACMHTYIHTDTHMQSVTLKMKLTELRR